MLDYVIIAISVGICDARQENKGEGNMIQRNNEILQDALGLLLDNYHKIMRVNLTTDTFEEVGVREDEAKEINQEAISLSEWFLNFAQSENIYDEDREEFIAFVNFKYLTQELEKKKHVSMHYRRKSGDKYHWVSMEIKKTAEYTPQNQVLMIFVRDIHEDFVGQLDKFLENTLKAIYSMKVNLTHNTCEKGYYDEFIEEAATFISDKYKESYKQTFSRQKLVENFWKGETKVTLEHVFYQKRKERCFVQTTIEMVENSYTGDIEAVLYGFDITQEYISRKLPELLYQSEFESVSIIDAPNHTYKLQKFDVFHETEKNTLFDYEEVRKSQLEHYIPKEDAEMFLQFTELSTILENLKDKREYEFTIYHFDKSGNKRLKKYKYLYFEENMGVLLNTVEDVTHLMEKDVLTGGLNRRGFIRIATEIMKNSSEDAKFAVVYINVNNFKAVNEMFGMEGGDELLQHVYNYMVDSSFHPLVVGRLEADHFVCLLEQKYLDYNKIGKLCKLIYSSHGRTFTVYAKCGVYLVEDKNMKVSGMCDRAKLAKKYITDEYIQPYAIYDDSMHIAYMDKSEVLSDVTSALDNNEFRVYYQPVYEAKTGKLASAEALVRWVHPKRGIVSPGLFIPVLEESGHISRIDYFVESSVKKFLKRRMECNLPVVSVSVNLSWMDFYDVNMMNSLLQDMKEGKVARGMARYEVTETSYAALNQYDDNMLHTLKQMGAKILLDDFGSGYSSFSTVRDYDFDMIKLDMGFVQQIGESEKAEGIIHSVIDMAHHMNTKVIAEGVETKKQVDFLVEHECDYIQGYYFSKPLTEAEFEKLLDSEQLAE